MPDQNPTTVILRHLLELYEHDEDVVNIEITKRRIEDLQATKAAMEEKAAKPRRTLIPRKVKEPKEPKQPKPTRAERIAAKNAKKAAAKPVTKVAKKRKII